MPGGSRFLVHKTEQQEANIMNKKYLYLTSDDFGMTSSINEGILLAYQHGLLSSANFMVPCPWFEHAVALSKNMEIDLGVHLTLTGEWDLYRWRPITGKSSLTDENGYFYQDIATLMQKAKEVDIVRECEAQIDIALNKQVNINYVDLHMCLPSISGVMPNQSHELRLMKIVSEIAQKYGLPYAYETRNDSLVHFDSALSISSKSQTTVGQYLENLDNGIHHMSFHCAVDSLEQSSLTPNDAGNYKWAAYHRRTDTRFLLSDWFKHYLDKKNIHIARKHFKDHRKDCA